MCHFNIKNMIVEKVKLYKGDSLSILDELINERVKVSHIITDPPFNISQKNNFDTLRGKNGRQVHRRGIDFGEWDWGFD